MKTHVITVSESFLKGHPRAGEPTYFPEKINSGEKIHTIRENAKYWKKVVDEVNSGKARLSVRIWTGKPYRSKQAEIAEFFQLGFQLIKFFGVENIPIKISELEKKRPDVYIDTLPYCTTRINGGYKSYMYRKLAENDGLTMDDFQNWFNLEKFKEFYGCIIHFTDFRY